jgi:hypothetical protein
MNTDSLAKHYDKLRPQERHVLILAAHFRGDATEAARLERTAPRVGYAVPDYYPLVEGFQVVALHHLARVLHLCSALWQAIAESQNGAVPTGERLQQCLEQIVRVRAYQLLTYVSGWERFCAGLQIPAGVLEGLLSPAAALEETVQRARSLAYNAQEVAEWAARWQNEWGREANASVRVITVEDVAHELRRAMEQQTATWK